MAKKLQRVFRDRDLTPEEIAADKEVREKVQAEFPPMQPAVKWSPSPLGDLLRQAIRNSGRSTDEIASDAGVSPELIERFLAGERDIHLKTADRLARALGLEVTAG